MRTEAGTYKLPCGGTRIGLAIAKEIVEQQGLRIWFECEEGKGTKFFFTTTSWRGEQLSNPGRINSTNWF